ncbi:MAG: TorD/DmsD family molecular chaperone [Conexivisphaera sp.]
MSDPHPGLYPDPDLEQARARAALYGLFSVLFLKPEEGAEMDESRRALLRIAGCDGDGSGPDAIDLDPGRLEVEYNRLFVGPGHVPCPPYESVYRRDRPLMEWGLVMGPSTIDVRRMYGEAGLAVSSDFMDLPDHVAAELEFMRYLCAMEAEDRAGRERWRGMQVKFLRSHIMPWYAEFLECVKDSARSKFYVVLADALREFLEEEIDYLVIAHEGEREASGRRRRDGDRDQGVCSEELPRTCRVPRGAGAWRWQRRRRRGPPDHRPARRRGSGGSPGLRDHRRAGPARHGAGRVALAHLRQARQAIRLRDPRVREEIDPRGPHL